jgi:hypothetical protein
MALLWHSWHCKSQTKDRFQSAVLQKLVPAGVVHGYKLTNRFAQEVNCFFQIYSTVQTKIRPFTGNETNADRAYLPITNYGGPVMATPST